MEEMIDHHTGDCRDVLGTVGAVALELGRRAVLIELNPEYVTLSEMRTNVTPGLQGLA